MEILQKRFFSSFYFILYLLDEYLSYIQTEAALKNCYYNSMNSLVAFKQMCKMPAENRLLEKL
jgi:hypothetical protein